MLPPKKKKEERKCGLKLEAMVFDERFINLGMWRAENKTATKKKKKKRNTHKNKTKQNQKKTVSKEEWYLSMLRASLVCD